MKEIYIIVSDTNTLISKIIGQVTKSKYNHVSISLKKDMSTVYSFARFFRYTPYPAGFIREPVKTRMANSDVIIIALTVSNRKYQRLSNKLDEMYQQRKAYKFNYHGIIFAAINRNLKCKNRFYCSQFIKSILVDSGIKEETAFRNAARPSDFLELFDKNIIYDGKLKDVFHTIPSIQLV